ncbi:MAG: HlyC/CorC family transporter, partial [Candidatus Krumholzibacteria bacterium]|nr:HlyC/CorC family transporter [Candidatus Krumholzibacteria bacterium]
KGSWCPRLMHRGRLHLILTLIGLELVIVSVIAIWLSLAPGGGGYGRGFWFSIFLPFVAVVASLAVVTVGGLGLASRNPERFAFIISYPLFPFYLLFRPLAGLFLKIVSVAFPDLAGEIASSFFLFSGSDEGGEGFIEENGSRLMYSIVEFGAKKVREVMVPRIDVFALDIHTPIEEIQGKVCMAGHSRVPVYDGGIDRIVGILYVKDLLRVHPDDRSGSDLGSLVRETYYVPEGKKIDDLLREFQREKKHMAIVIDEYGGTSGIVTLEDILEEIVGEIRDEYDHEAPLVREMGHNEFNVAGRVNLDDLNDSLKVSIPTDGVDTLGGFLYNLIGRIPKEGEEVQYEGIKFKISRLDGQRIAEVLLHLPER